MKSNPKQSELSAGSQKIAKYLKYFFYSLILFWHFNVIYLWYSYVQSGGELDLRRYPKDPYANKVLLLSFICYFAIGFTVWLIVGSYILKREDKLKTKI